MGETRGRTSTSSGESAVQRGVVGGDESVGRSTERKTAADETYERRIKHLTDEIDRLKSELEKMKRNSGVSGGSRRNTRNSGVRYTPLDMTSHSVPNYSKYLVINILGEEKRKVNPFRAFKELENRVRGKISNLTSLGRNALLVTVCNKEQGDVLMKMTRIDGKDCRVEPHRTMNTSKGLVYISEFDITEDELKEGLEDQGVLDVKTAFWIKTKRPELKVFLVTFSSDSPPEFVRIPGESLRTRVSEYTERPMQCKVCQEYNHTAKRCPTPNAPRCGRCSLFGHSSSNCDTENTLCCHCSGNHTAWNKKCPEYIFQAEVSRTQQKEKTSRREAVRAVSARYPERRTTFANRSSVDPAGPSSNTAEPMQTEAPETPLGNVGSKRKMSKENRKEGKSPRRAVNVMVSDVESDEETLESTLRQIYDQYTPNGAAEGTKKKKKLNSPQKNIPEKKCRTLYVAMMTISKEATLNEDRMVKELEKYNVARFHYHPHTEEEEETEAVLIGLEKFPNNIYLTNNKKPRVTLWENFTERQREHLREAINSENGQ